MTSTLTVRMLEHGQQKLRSIQVDVAEVIGAFEITLNADGSASMLEEGDTLSCDWEPTENGLKMTDSTQVDFTYEDGKLVTEMSGVTFYFEKK